MIHSDLAEANVISIGGGKYVLTFTDDATDHGTIFILANKKSSTVLNAFKEYQAWAERQSGRKIKEIRVDRGTEYMGEMLKYVKSQGIEYNPTAGYSPQSNGVAERMNRTLFNMGCMMLDSSGAPLELWGEAVLAACHIRNRLPTSKLGGKTPFEAWTGKKPTVGHIRKWGCKVYRHINKRTGRKKLDKKSMAGFLVGYQPGNIYRIYHPSTNKVKVSRDVIFSESQFFNEQHNEYKDEPAHGLEMELGLSENGEDERDIGATVGENDDGSEDKGQSEIPAPVIPDEIVVQPPPLKPPNRRSRRLIARAFKAMLKGNWKWPRNYREAMEAEDAKQWELTMKKEYNSIMKNETSTLVPRPHNAKVVKSRWVLRTKDNGMYKARFYARGFTQ